MKAAVYTGRGVLSVKEVPTPSPGPEQLLVRVTYCGICGTDLHNYSFGVPAPGAILGHEWCGVIEELGDGVEDFQIGDRVMYYPAGGFGFVGAGKRQQSERPNPRALYSAPGRKGAYAEYITVSSSRAKRVPDEVSDEAAASLEPLVAAIHAVRLGNMRISDTVAFIGAGPIALYMIQRARQAGAGAIYVSEISAARQAKAGNLGADRVFNPLEEDFVSGVVELTGGKGPDIVFECAAGRDTLNQACRLVAANGRITCLAVYQGPITLEPLDWYMRQPEIKFTTNGDSTPLDWEIALECICERTIDVESIVSNIVSLDELQNTFQTLLNPPGNNMLRVLVKP